MGAYVRANPLVSLLSAGIITIALLIGWNNKYHTRVFSRTLAVGPESHGAACTMFDEGTSKERIYFVNCGGFF